jgi:hypothetical protein
MKELILALALILSTPAFSQHVSVAPGVVVPTDEQIKNTGQLCLGILANKIQVQDVLDKLHLTTKEQQQSLVTSCLMYGQGFEDALEAVQKSNENRHTTSVIK